jgi:hypothetical protein
MEFLDLWQGIDNVYMYIEKFNYLAQYNTYHVGTIEKRTEPSALGSLSLVSEYVIQHPCECRD